MFARQLVARAPHLSEAFLGQQSDRSVYSVRIDSYALPSPRVKPTEGTGNARPHCRALLSYDETAAHRSVDHLREIGRLSEEGQLTVAQEHFASTLIRRRLSGLARGWEDGIGPRALLACPPDEDNDIPLMMLGISLCNRGWRITYRGARTPADDLVGG